MPATRKVHLRSSLYPESGIPICRNDTGSGETFAMADRVEDVTCVRCRHYHFAIVLPARADKRLPAHSPSG